MNGYDLSRIWFDFCFENPEKINPNHTALYFFAIEHCNRLGWKSKFGFPTTMAMEAIGIKSYNTYIKVLNDLISFGFITLIQKSSNQYSSNIIALSNFNKALDKALDKALIKHSIKQDESNVQSIDSIIKQLNKEHLNIETLEKLQIIVDSNNSTPTNIEDENNTEPICNLENIQLEKSRKFYDKQIDKNKDSENINKYKRFINVLFGDNKVKEVYSGVLSIPIQLRYDVFCEILEECKKRNKKLFDILMKISNKNKYYEGFNSLPILIYKWLETDFK